ncbi:unnamed protein product [Ascophyllum nodosum]
MKWLRYGITHDPMTPLPVYITAYFYPNRSHHARLTHQGASVHGGPIEEAVPRRLVLPHEGRRYCTEKPQKDSSEATTVAAVKASTAAIC